LAQDGASTIPECLLTANRIVPGESESWFREWKRSGQESRARAERALAQGNIETAKSNWLRASNYFRTAGVFLEMDDKRRSPLLAEMENCSRHYLEHMTPIGEVIQILQGDGSSLPAHFLKAPAGPPKKPVVICLCALDQIKDESFDAEIPVGYCVDNLQVRDYVDIERVVLYGSKFWGPYASRAASRDHRFAVAVCDGGMWDQLERVAVLEWVCAEHGSDKCEALTQSVKQHGLIKNIACPILVVADEYDWIDSEYIVGFCCRAKK
jgi:hypothetical protein